MASAVNIRGLSEFTAQMKRVAAMVPGGDVAEAMKGGAEVILEEAKDNILRQGLVNSGALYESGKVVKVNQYRVDIIFDKIYAAVHEYGLPKGGKGVFSATAKQIRFFWAKFMETKEAMWKALALKKGYTIKPRPYLTPAVMSKQQEAAERTSNLLWAALVKKLGG